MALHGLEAAGSQLTIYCMLGFIICSPSFKLLYLVYLSVEGLQEHLLKFCATIIRIVKDV